MRSGRTGGKRKQKRQIGRRKSVGPFRTLRSPVVRSPVVRSPVVSLGSLDVRFANCNRDIRLAQRLRYAVFFEEMAGQPDMAARLRRRDEDEFDSLCDHLLVEDREADLPRALAGFRKSSREPAVVGTYRVLRDDVARRQRRDFYTQREYDIAGLIDRIGDGNRFMELGRSCVLAPYRNKRTVELLWHGLWSYVRRHKVDVMIGCASFPGTDPDAHALALSFLHHHARAPQGWSVRAHEALYCSMDLLPGDEVDARAALRALPPLIKGYLRLGAFVGDGAVIDRHFGTIDVLIVLPVSRINPRYFTHFGGPDDQVGRGFPRSVS